MTKHPFFKWFNRRRKTVVGIVSLVIVIVQVVSTVGSARDRLPDDVAGFLAQHLPLIPAGLHLIAIFVMILLAGRLSTLTTVEPGEDRDYVRARMALQTIYHYWSVLLISWLIFYIFLTINYTIFSTDGLGAATNDCLTKCATTVKASSGSSGRLFDSADTYLMAAENLLNNIPTLMFFMLFWEMSETTLESDGKGGVRRKARSNPWFALIASLLVFSAAEVFYRGMNFDPSWRLAFTLAPAIASAVAMALFIGRIESKYINPPRVLIILLYTYAGIQPLFAMFDVHPVLGLTMYTVALFLKICLFILMYWLISEGRLLYYISKTNEIEQTVDAEFHAFCEKHGIQQSL